jgi:hypothetical protein
MSTSESSSQSTSPTEPLLPSETLSTDPAEHITPELENDIDLSTLRFLAGTLRHTFLPYLGWIIAFTSFAKLTRFFSPYLFRATRWTADWGFWGFEKLIKFLAWSSMWLGMLAAVVWILGGIGLGLAWLAIKAKPAWRRSLQERPVLTKFVARAIVELACWRTARRWLGVWIGKGVVVLSLGWEGYTLLQAATSNRQPKTSLNTRPTPTSTATKDDMDERGGDEKAEQWARKVREEMLRDSLLRRGRSSGTNVEAEDPEFSVAEEDR